MPRVNNGIINSGRIGGHATVRSTTRRIGDEIRIEATGSVVNVKGRMERLRQHVRAAPTLPAATRAELEDVMSALAARVQAVEERMPAESERVLDALEALSKELGRPKPDAGFLESAWKGLKSALGLVADALPEIVGLAKRLAALLALSPI